MVLSEPALVRPAQSCMSARQFAALVYDRVYPVTPPYQWLIRSTCTAGPGRFTARSPVPRPRHLLDRQVGEAGIFAGTAHFSLRGGKIATGAGAPNTPA